MKGRYSDIWAFSGVFLLLAAYLASGYAAAQTGRTLSSALLATGVLLACGALLYFLDGRTRTDSGILVPAIYIATAAAHPESLVFTPFHAATLLTGISMAFYIVFHCGRPSTEIMAACCLTAGAAALIEPPMLWLSLVFIATSAGRAEDKGRFWIAAVLSLLLPLAVRYGIAYLQGRFEPLGPFLSGFWARMTAIRKPVFSGPDATLFRVLLLALAALLSIASALKRLHTWKIAQSRATVCCITMLPACCLLVLLFYLTPSVPAGMLTALPLAPLLGQWLSRPEQKKTNRTLAFVLILVLLTERAACFLQ